MIALNHRLTLEMTTLNSQATVHIKKNDTKNKLVVSLSENGKPYKLSKNVYAAFVGKKPDGKIVFNDCDIVGNTITYTITAQTSVVAGIVACEIRLYDINDNLLTSPNFTVVVDETIYNADDIQTESENEINVLDSLISEARKLIDEVEKSKLVFVSYGTTTHAEIYEAYRNNKTVFCRMGQAIYPLMSYSAGEAYFTGMSISGKPIVVRCEAPNTWSSSTIDVGGAGTFIAEYDVTPFADIAAAVENGKAVYCKATHNGEPFFMPLTNYAEDIARFVLTCSYHSQAEEITLVTYNIFVGADDCWDYDDWNNIAKINFGDNEEQLATAIESYFAENPVVGTPGKDGTNGTNGKDGTSVTVSKVTESTADGGSNVVTFSDGKTLTVKNGSKGDKGDTGSAGERGTGILKVTTAPTSYTTAIGGKNPIKRMSISTIKTQANVDEVLVGDCISHSYYLYHIYYLDATYAYMDTSQSIRGATGSAGAAGANGKDGTSVTVSKVTESTADGGSNVVTFSDGKTLTIKNGSKGDKGKAAYEYAQDGGYTGTEAQFTSDLSQIGNRADKDYLISVFEELKTAIAESNIDAAVAVLDKAILDLSTLS